MAMLPMLQREIVENKGWATEEELSAAYNRLTKHFPEAKRISDMPVREYMIKWLRSFAPDMIFSEAKAFCLPRHLFKNYLWHAFSYQKTDSLIEEDADEKFAGGFEGECYVLLNDENLLCTVPDGTVFSPEKLKEFNNIIVFKKDFSETYVYTGKEDCGPFYKAAEE